MKDLLNPLIEHWPYLVSLLISLISCILMVFITRAKTKKAQAEIELQKIELEKAYLDNSFVVCTKCGAELHLKDLKPHIKT